jgi:hypothetical protein
MPISIYAQLQKLKERYFRPVMIQPIGHLCHCGDCDIYRPIEIYRFAPCTCGFNYDLRWVGWDYVSKLNPNFGNEYRLQEVGVFWEGKIDSKEMDAIWEASGAKLNNIEPRTRDDEKAEWGIIEVALGREYVDFLQSLVHDQECVACGWTWRGEASAPCRYCLSLEAFKSNQ